MLKRIKHRIGFTHPGQNKIDGERKTVHFGKQGNKEARERPLLNPLKSLLWFYEADDKKQE